MIITFVSRLKY